jgi:hypothetical protein
MQPGLLPELNGERLAGARANAYNAGVSGSPCRTGQLAPKLRQKSVISSRMPAPAACWR